MTKHSELDNTIAELYDPFPDDGFATEWMHDLVRTFNGNCMALGHVRRYVHEAAIIHIEKFDVRFNKGEVRLVVYRDDGGELASWRLWRWKAVREGKDA